MIEGTVDKHGAAEILHVHYKTVEDLINQGVLPACQPGAKLVLLKRDVYAYLEKLIAKQTAERLGPRPRAKRVRRRAVA